jgi:hypothetical protein
LVRIFKRFKKKLFPILTRKIFLVIDILFVFLKKNNDDGEYNNNIKIMSVLFVLVHA